MERSFFSSCESNLRGFNELLIRREPRDINEMAYVLDGKVAVVTGAAQGIGRAFVEAIVENGGQVVVADIGTETGQKACEEIEKKWGKNKAIFIRCDVTEFGHVENAIKLAVEKFGRIDLLINNAGICEETSIKKTIDINCTALVVGTLLGVQYMSKMNGGSGGTIVNIASVTTIDPWASLPVYTGTKAFVNQFSRSMGAPAHYKENGVRVISINPGMTDTMILSNAMKTSLHAADLAVQFPNYPIQKTKNMGDGLIKVLQNAESGSLWIIENDEEARRLSLELKRI